MGNYGNEYNIAYENRNNEYEKGLIAVATGEYNLFIPKLIKSSQDYFKCHFYLFTDKPEKYKEFKDITVVEVDHLGWPKMPLLRFELLYNNFEIFKEEYLFLIDSEAIFKKKINNHILSKRVATLHRNITRFRSEFNYEDRKDSTAFVDKNEGEKYYACGFVGGENKEFKRMLKKISENIRKDIGKGIRAIWGDESHLNRYLIDNPPTLVLPPNYMCPETNPYFIPYIKHRDKQFKRVNKTQVKKYLNIDKKDYE